MDSQSGPARPGQLGDRNRDVFDQPDVIAELSALHGFIDPGESAALRAAARSVRGQRALDVGVGPGRTVPLMQLMTDDYVAIDYAERSVQVCAARWGVDVRVADVRDLSEFESAAFGFVSFSFNGIDGLDHDDRDRALSEMVRVLRPGGLLLYSTLNMYGVSGADRPLQLHRAGVPLQVGVKPLLRLMIDAPRRIRSRSLSYANWRHSRAAIVESADWMIRPLASHNYSAMVHFTSNAGVRAELARHDLELIAAFGNSGEPVDLHKARAAEDYFHVLACRSRMS